ncbi:hypothetical protein [Geodermatophilus sabuli]|uniref:Uncharacterized protein n=1 Tax=Geodermatophilus sabuli TaxID=1564158 RepID=A0A285EA31_9ACTN|nr:hypothetical protein [Geodermatophilus sabuli]MBB3084859.1 hypothetical protein [Geodermatophilus sabuli]SNX95733.1 hypothetical protein SAMN06893097_102437 [Geodermatophilus sabuli]
MNAQEHVTASTRDAERTPPRLHRRILALVVSFAVVSVLGMAAGGAAAAAPPAAALEQAVTGTVNGVATEGTLDIQRFVVEDGALQAVGTLTGFGPAPLDVTWPVDLNQTTGTCEILNLVLGPLDLDLLGLVIHLDQVVLTITAEQGPGNLLGNLLCAIAGLLDGPGNPLGGIAALLNRILAILG